MKINKARNLKIGDIVIDNKNRKYQFNGTINNKNNVKLIACGSREKFLVNSNIFLTKFN